jgi:hypothetical protein
MVEILRHHQTKGVETDMFDLKPPRHTSTLPNESSLCAVERRDRPVGDRPTRQLSLQPVAIGAVVEVTIRLKPSMERVT